MGFYFQGPLFGKGELLVSNHGAVEITINEAKTLDPVKTGLFVVVNNGPFEAAGFAYDTNERDEFCRPDPRPKRFFTVDRKVAENISGFDERMR